MGASRRSFPHGFLWGAATASHQVEGGNDNDWTSWEAAGGSKDLSGSACCHWDLDRFRSDMDLLASLKLNAYRLSIEWSRVMPRPGVIDGGALRHYREMLRICKERGITTMVTLHHFTNPTWFARSGGWERGDLAPFLRYVRETVLALDDLVDLWATVNEPVGYALMGWVLGAWPPGKQRSLRGMVRVARRLAAAHNAAYRIVKGITKTPVGLVHSMICFDASSSSVPDRFIAWAANYFGNQWFLRKTRSDFIGVNYYFRRRFRLAKWLAPRVEEVQPEGDTTEFGWEIHPKGIHTVLLSLRRYGVPVYVTENGIADAADAKRAEFIRSHLRWVRRAIEDGVPVAGYFHWSLLDNFEWAEGYSKRFGLIETDFATQERRIRASALVYRDIAAANAIEEDDKTGP